MEKVYVVTLGSYYSSYEDDVSNQYEESVVKVFSTKQKATAYVISESGKAPDEYDRVVIDTSDDSECIADCIIYTISEHDLE